MLGGMFNSAASVVGPAASAAFGTGSIGGINSVLTSHLSPFNRVLGSTFSPYLTGMDYSEYVADPNYMYDPSYQRAMQEALISGVGDAPGSIFKNFLKAQMMLVGTTRLSALALGKSGVGQLTPVGLRNVLWGGGRAATSNIGKLIQKGFNNRFTQSIIGGITGTSLLGNPVLGAGVSTTIAKYGIRGEFGDVSKRRPGFIGAISRLLGTDKDIGTMFKEFVGQESPALESRLTHRDVYNKASQIRLNGIGDVVSKKDLHKRIDRTTTTIGKGMDFDSTFDSKVAAADVQIGDLNSELGRTFRQSKGRERSRTISNIFNKSNIGNEYASYLPDGSPVGNRIQDNPIAKALKAAGLRTALGNSFVRELAGGTITRNLLSLGMGMAFGPLGAMFGAFGPMGMKIGSAGYMANLKTEVDRANKRVRTATNKLERESAKKFKKTLSTEDIPLDEFGYSEEEILKKGLNPNQAVTATKVRSTSGHMTMKSAELSTRGIIARSSTVALMTGIRSMYVVGGVKKLAGYAMDTGLNTIRNVVSLSRNIGRMEFGSGRTLDTQQASTERGRAIQAMQNVGISARSYLGQEAKLVNAI